MRPATSPWRRTRSVRLLTAPATLLSAALCSAARRRLRLSRTSSSRRISLAPRRPTTPGGRTTRTHAPTPLPNRRQRCASRRTHSPVNCSRFPGTPPNRFLPRDGESSSPPCAARSLAFRLSIVPPLHASPRAARHSMTRSAAVSRPAPFTSSSPPRRTPRSGRWGSRWRRVSPNRVGWSVSTRRTSSTRPHSRSAACRSTAY